MNTLCLPVCFWVKPDYIMSSRVEEEEVIDDHCIVK